MKKGFLIYTFLVLFNKKQFKERMHFSKSPHMLALQRLEFSLGCKLQSSMLSWWHAESNWGTDTWEAAHSHEDENNGGAGEKTDEPAEAEPLVVVSCWFGTVCSQWRWI